MTQHLHAPELPKHLQWLNTPAPLSLASQRGKIVLLDFWTYCCINCMHVLPDLRYLEEKYPQDITVIGIHSPKFTNEQVAENVQKAINRYDIRHPVAHDPQLSVWREWGVRAWPTVVVVDAEGYIAGVFSGEGRRFEMERLIEQLVLQAERNGTRRKEFVPHAVSDEPVSDLRFPGKVIANDKYLFISDSGNNRVLWCDHDGLVIAQFGTGEPGFQNGGPLQTHFNDPQGMVLVEKTLYVCDTGNHAIRALDLPSGDVTTLAGIGTQGSFAQYLSDAPAKSQLNSPWDIAYRDGVLFIAMAGAHQLWLLDSSGAAWRGHIGSSHETLQDGAPEEAALAQPSGIAVGPQGFFIADSETSSIRSVRFGDYHVETLVGLGLFEFGDRDGLGKDVRLQHPLGVCYNPQDQCVWIADTYNHKIKILEPNTRSVREFPLRHPLHEPAGLALHDGTLWIANTNQHQVLRVEMATARAEVLELKF